MGKKRKKSMIPITGVPILKGEGSVHILLELYI
jgi:hypothetical protein